MSDDNDTNKDLDAQNVVLLPVRKKPADGERYLKAVSEFMHDKCDHRSGPFEVDIKLDTVECGRCKAKVSAVWVLKQMASAETRWHTLRADYQAEMKRLNERSRTKCEHCQRMTRISRA